MCFLPRLNSCLQEQRLKPLLRSLFDFLVEAWCRNLHITKNFRVSRARHSAVEWPYQPQRCPSAEENLSSSQPIQASSAPCK